MDNRYYRKNRRKYKLKVHIVIVTKYRKQLLPDHITADVKQKILDVANNSGWNIIAMETAKDHIRLTACGRNIAAFFPNSIGRSEYSGQTDIFRSTCSTPLGNALPR